MSALSQLPQHIQLPKTPAELSQAQRLFHGRGHAYQNLHHVTVDWLPPILITLFAPEARAEIEILADYILSHIPACQSVQLQHRDQLSGPIEIIHGKTITHLTIQEGALHYSINLGQARNTGLFLDMRNGRKWVQENSANKRVLNLFSYTCGFSVAAIAGKAKSVLNVDMSSAALTVGPLNQVRFEKLDIFKSFSRFKKRGPFDLLICDPPTLQKGSVDIARDYPKILRRLDQFMAPNATLLLCLNAPELSRDYLIEHMTELAPQYKLMLDIKPPEVYREAEGKGLKILCFNAMP